MKINNKKDDMNRLKIDENQNSQDFETNDELKDTIDNDLKGINNTDEENLQNIINNLNIEIEKLKTQINEQQDKILRTFAELDNVRKRSNEDVAKARKFSIENFAESLIPVKDSIEAALSNYNSDIHVVKEGLEVTLKQISSAFEKNFLKEIFPKSGDKFDPHMHQAMSSISSDQPINSIVDVLQKGYIIHDRIIRPALVSVSSGIEINTNK
ncbi:Protein GrpE [Candidatus Kinetoplastibacterium sorsogonicusi]|uniref:Protein GrpE n=1 Tax=Candidatus Kinetoplastidibacterium kentomonadis TaxID=1576550 RepID=A0A3S7JAB3_9PROT|nr:nucleotide exchange factor GrpE [Candidatus Kinetoplastibacterium sorsogonicusi]AWD32615.1 Protein GrpE [Candidatus Kinetoplastibacterium sorsogonicusi]